MPELLIYVPGIDPETAEAQDALTQAGLSGLLPTPDLPSRVPIARGCGRGPDEAHGAVLGWTDPEKTGHHALHEANFVGYFPHIQRWTKQESGVWFGLEHGRQVKPAALRRETEFDSAELKLDDGQPLSVPLVFGLPSEIHYHGGAAERTYREAFRPIVDQATRVHTVFAASRLGREAEDPMSVADFWLFAADVLALNYSLTRELVEWLGILRTPLTMLSVCAAAIERPGIVEWNQSGYAMPDEPMPDEPEVPIAEAAGATS